jgi:hypothetical protein
MKNKLGFVGKRLVRPRRDDRSWPRIEAMGGGIVGRKERRGRATVKKERRRLKR